MKKFISFCLVVVLAFCLPLNAFAASDDVSHHADIIVAACEAFPEYAQEIRDTKNQNNATYSVSTNNEIIHSETRNVSETQFINLTQYADGTYYITEGTYSAYTVLVDQTSQNHVTNVTLNIETVRNNDASSYFKIKNIKYVLYASSEDEILDAGTASSKGKFTHKVIDIKLLEDTSPAFLDYMLSYDVGQPTPQQIEIYFKVGNNAAQLIKTEYDS